MKYYKIIVDKATEEELILNSKLKDQRILYSKRINLIKDQINQWIEDKSNYYNDHNIPFDNSDKGNNDLRKYIEDLKRIGKFPVMGDKEKENYSFQDYKNYINERNYQAINNKTHSIVERFNEERSLMVLPPSTTKIINKQVYASKVSKEMQEKYLQHIQKQPITSPAQNDMNVRMLQSLRVPIIPSGMGRREMRALPYRPTTSNAINNNNSNLVDITANENNNSILD